MTFAHFQYFQLVSVVSGIAFFSFVKKESMIWFFLLSLSGFLIETIATWWVFDWHYPDNYFLMNLYSVVALTLIFAGFYKHLELSARSKIWYITIAVIIVILLITDYVLTVGAARNSIFGNIGFNFCTIILCCTWLFKMAIKEEVFNFFDEPLFWVASGLLIFCLGALVVMGMSQFIRINHITIQNKPLYRVIMPMLNVVLYSSFTYAFLLCRLKKKSYSLSSL